MLTKVLKNIDEKNITISEWIIAFAGIVFIRFILENFSSPTVLGFLVSDADTLIQYALFFIVAPVGLALILYFFDNKNKNTIKYFLFGLPILWLPPIIDIITSGGKGVAMVYVSDSHKQLFYDFLTFFGSNNATFGIKAEIFISLLVIGYYIWNKYKNVTKTIFSVLLSYTLLFILGSIPGIIYTIAEPLNHITNTSEYLKNIITNSNFIHNTFHPTVTPISYYRFLEIGFDKLISQIIFVIGIIITFFWFWNTEKEKTKVVLKNSRPERIGFYFVLIFLGMGYAFINTHTSISSWIDYLSILILLISWYGACMFAIHINDIADVSIDSISNKNRPLVENKISNKEMKEIGSLWLTISLVGSFIVGPYMFFMNLVFTSAYYIYSAPPLRFKRIPVFSSFLISVACLSSALVGFFLLSEVKSLTIFSPIRILGILLIITTAVNVRDVKDIEGDKANNIKTLPVLFGKNGKKITGILFALSFLLVPIFFSFYTLYLIAIPTAIVGYRIVMKKKYEEKYIFILYFIFCILTVILITGLNLFAKTLS